MTTPTRRQICHRCDKPVNTCLCNALPEEPIQLHRTKLLILEHPQEQKRKNRSLPFITFCMKPVVNEVGRRFGDQTSPEARELLHSKDAHIWLLFPHPDAIPLTQAIESVKDCSNPIHLILLDATWTYSKNMDEHNVKTDAYPEHMLRITLDKDDFASIQPRRFHIRTPPTDQHLSTAECAAWVVSRIEDDPTIYETVLRPMDLMVEQWESLKQQRILSEH